MNRPRVFVSFSHKDNEFVQRLFDRLRAQPLELWDYSREGDEIPGGCNVHHYLEERIERCDVFLAVVSPNSFASDYAKHEVTHALRQSRSGLLRIIPLVLTPYPQMPQWPGPYDELKKILGYLVRPGASNSEERAEVRMSLEETLRRLCRVLTLEYSPLPVEDPRLPFMDKFDQELKDAQTKGKHFRNESRQIDIFGRLARARTEVTEAIQSVIPASLQNLKKVCGGVFLGGAAGLTAQPISGV